VEAVRPNTFTYRDAVIEATILPGEQGIDFRLANETAHAVKVIWDDAVFLDFDGTSRRVVHSGIRYGDHNSPQVPTVIAPRGHVQDVIVPVDRIWKSETGGFLNLGLVPRLTRACGDSEDEFKNQAKSYEGQSFGVLLPIAVGGVVSEYTFRFEVRRANLLMAYGCKEPLFVQGDAEIKGRPWPE
jgi:hypothetical protein